MSGLNWEFTATPELRTALAKAVEAAAASQEEHAERYKSWQPTWAVEALNRAAELRRNEQVIVDSLIAAATCGGEDRVKPVQGDPDERVQSHLRAVAASGLISAPACVLMHRAYDGAGLSGHYLVGHLSDLVDGDTRPSLDYLITLMDECGFDGVKEILGFWKSSTWPADEFQASVVLHSERVAEIAARSQPWALRQLKAVEQWAEPVEGILTEAGLTAHKDFRRSLQDVLDSRGTSHRPQVISALSSRQAPIRLEAAQWLRRSPGADAVSALAAAFAKEKQDAVIGALLDALVAAGKPVADYLGFDTVGERAGKALAKGLPKELDWVPWETAPQMHWADASVVDLVVIQWLVVMAVKSKSPEPGALVRAYAGLLEAGDAQEFGLWLLRGWLAADTAPIDGDEALIRATERAQSEYSWVSTPGYSWHPRFGWSVEDIAQAYVAEFLGAPAGSAISSKGVLGVVAATAKAGVAPLVGAYLKQWFGTRAAQGKALIAMLGWVDDRAATSLLLSVGSRFRTKSFSDEATRAAAALAERKGWTIPELADRTVPTAGIDERGVLELSYGDRHFTAKVSDGMVFVLADQDGKPVKSLPPARLTDDADAVKAAKKSLTAAKKELKETVSATSARLYEALVADRSWSGADWREFVLGHPIVGRLAPRVLWQMSDGTSSMVVRPLPDGTVSNIDDETVDVADTARVQLAHSSAMTAEDVSAWAEHLADYEVNSLFDQLTRAAFAVAADSQETELTDRRGYVLGGFAFRSAASKLGYTRGEVGDGGWLMDYRKRFPALGLTAVLGFTGNALPEEDRLVAMTTVSFLGEQGRVLLAEVPPVLLSEVHADAVQIASVGTGYDENWEKTTRW